MSPSPKPFFLHHDWEFRGHDRTWRSATVPGCVHRDLQDHGIIGDPFFGTRELELKWIEETPWHYRTSFHLDEEQLAEEHVHLVCEGLDTVAEVRVNGAVAGHSENMFTRPRFPVKHLLRTGKNRLEIEFRSPMDYIRARKHLHYLKESNDPVGGASSIRKQQCSFGWDWGPRLPSSGIYRPIYLHCWSHNYLTGVRFRQTHKRSRVHLQVTPETAFPAETGEVHVRVLFDGAVVAQRQGEGALDIPNPQLWWPAGQGEQPLYTVEISLLHEGNVISRLERKIGLRTIELIRQPDEWGESFHFRVNGRDIFSKGANWIPAHSFPSEVTPEDFLELIQSAVDANMNMLRVWGGGLYEEETFYDLCDELGVLVWQDFMFACALYPGDPHFLNLIRDEARTQIERLRHRACLALWCGNNELEWHPLWKDKEPSRLRDYGAVFNDLLPQMVARLDGVTPYWPCSPHKPETFPGQEKEGADAGDTHDWAVWHGLVPASHFEKTRHRFCSEFGMQAYPHPEAIRDYVGEGELNIFSRDFENHQKHEGGNRKIFHYLSQFYRFPAGYRALAYLSQLNQAYCVRIGVEHWRRNMPCCMGALYWQLNDCWPVASWSSIDFGHRWKALQFAARRFYAPILVSSRLEGEVYMTKGNYYHNSITGAEIYTISDDPLSRKASLGFTLFRLDGEVVREVTKEVALRYGEARSRQHLDFKKDLSLHRAEDLVGRVTLNDAQSGELLSENTIMLSVPRFMPLAPTEIECTVADQPEETSRGLLYTLTLLAPHFHHAVELSLDGLSGRFVDNYLDLFPQTPRKVQLLLPAKSSVQRKTPTSREIARALRFYSVADTAAEE